MKRHKAKVYQCERVIALGTGDAEGSVMVLAKRFNERVVVVITPEFMGELAKFAGDYSADVPGATPEPQPKQPVVDAVYDPETPITEQPSKVIDLMAALKESLAKRDEPKVADANAGVAAE